MNTAAIARAAVWNVIANVELPAGTKAAVGGGWVTIRPRGGRPARVPYGPADTPSSLHSALKDAAQAVTKDSK